MPIREIFLLAYESLVANKLRAGLTMLGMIIGVGAVILLVSIGNGAKNYITSEFEGLGTNLILLQPGKTDKNSGFGPPVGGSKEKLTLGDVEAIERGSNNVEAVTGIMYGAGTVKNGERANNIHILGASDKLIRIFNFKIILGSYFSQEEDFGRRVVVLGFNVNQNLFGSENPIGKLVKINDSEHRVIGVIEKSGNKLGFNMDEMVFIPTRSAMRLFNEDKLFGIRAKGRSRAAMDDAVSDMKQILITRHNGEEDFTILTQHSMLSTMDTILGMLTYVLGGIAMISMLVGGIGIMNIMLVNVTERTREIGIRRAVGAKKSDILRQFLAEAVALSVTGGAIGVAGATLLTWLVYFIKPSFDMRAPLWILPPAFLLSVLSGVVFGVWPAKKAANIETIEALRFE